MILGEIFVSGYQGREICLGILFWMSYGSLPFGSCDYVSKYIVRLDMISLFYQFHNNSFPFSGADLPPSYDIAAKLPTYEEAERVKETQDDLVRNIS